MVATNLRATKRLAAAVLKCGKNRVFLDPSASRATVLQEAGSRAQVRSLIGRGAILKKAVKGNSRYRCRVYREAKRKGRHMGLGKRKGTRNARCSFKSQWIRRIRLLRRVLRKYRAQKVIDCHTYHQFYLKAKGNQFRNKKVLVEALWDAKNAQNKEKLLAEQREARLARAAARKEKLAKKEAAALAATQE
ncbi:ribosomal protein L19 [Gregarina niphandrodes]|uniref:Ribosomal protein L19 n=1 Tax=Gregarina niphandrodes TaxID=110365 RepID=A0A023BA04_GRENI|nr:ribosomal protein L19 [Gregarina niphandrodes]EZG77191.1 ribosomal protein L19 [Gregarina niphandrodes]|eukprot:XP_011129527.1 ribosomal protein L19 [Gregarina niphandrodes]